MRHKTAFGNMDMIRSLLCLLSALVFKDIAGAILVDCLQGFYSKSTDESRLLFLAAIDLLLFLGLDFITVYFTLFIVRKKYRIISAVLLLYATLAFLIYNLNFSNTVLLINSVVQLSLGMTGAILAIFLHISNAKQPEKKLESPEAVDLNALMEQQSQNLNKKKPSLPKLFLGLALISVPSTYAILIISSFIVAGISIWGLVLVMYLPRAPIVLLVVLGLGPLIAFLIAYKALWATFDSKPHSEPAIILKKWKSFKMNLRVNLFFSWN